ncbi:hypothetical protein GLAREA_11102 [Glarea lozoyensis ATCC 20868]|uniref:Uncharacterized protein n=1 Tax=Glarea lozoyensis (strain ATCC 20868 / MF5171) TaxID=1116229 RepID=S3EAQ6_GLAL2|nr:uncharacterized protein GLAREA_11102 [Glarea lozoyensis ATCC 20868]EPE35403.1 hypothetical protein GLAREA_11102 [Glarea lozoyensis ATCC 20868]
MNLLILLLTTLPLALSSPAASPSDLSARQNTGCYCGVLTGTSCGSRTSTGFSLSGSCNANYVYECTEQFGNARVKSQCLICNSGGQDGFDACLLGLGLPGGK